MSRSYKKYPCVKDKNKFEKHFSNKKIRKIKDIKNGNYYKKIYNSYNITDWSISLTWNEYFKNEISKWKSKKIIEYYVSNKYKNESETHWSKQNPELYKKKHRYFWKISYCKK